MLRIDISQGHTAAIEISGDCDTVAGQIAAAVGLIYTRLCDVNDYAGEMFREAVTAMLADDASVWREARNLNLSGEGSGIVIVPPYDDQ